MDSAKGIRLRNGNRSGGIMYGAQGYYADDRLSRMLVSPEGDTLFVHYEAQNAFQAFDLVRQETYPKSEPLKGKVLGFESPGKVVVAVPDAEGKLTLRGEFDYHLNPVSGPKPMLAEVLYSAEGIRYALRDIAIDGRYHVVESKHAHWSDVFNSLAMYDETMLDNDPIKIYLGHFNNGVLVNVKEWSIENPKLVQEESVSVKEYIQNTIKMSSSPDLFAVFDESLLVDSDIESPVRVTLFHGNGRSTLKVRNPFLWGRSHECPLCPVWVSGKRFAYSRDDFEREAIELHEFTNEGKDIVIRLMYLDKYHIPIYADEDLVILYDTYDHGTYYSEDWRTIRKVEGDAHLIWWDGLTCTSRAGRTFEFFDTHSRYTFENGKLTRINPHSFEQELQLKDGKLRWRYGVVILEN